MNRKKDIALTLTGMAIGLALGTPMAAAALTASPSTQRFYLDGQPLSLEAYAINGNNYVKLRDIGRAVDFGVTYDAATNSVYIDTNAHYQADSPARTASPVNVSSCKGTTLPVGERSSLIISPSDVQYTVTSGNPSVVSIEQVSGTWVAVANGAGTAVITATAPDGSSGSVAITVNPGELSARRDVDLDFNLDIRNEIIRLVNEVRKQAGAPALTVSDALMAAAQIVSTQGTDFMVK